MLQSVTVQSSAKVAESAGADQTVARPDASFDLIGFVQAAASAQTPDASGFSVTTDAAAAKPLDPLTALMQIGQLAEKGLKASTFTEAVAEDQGLKIHVFPTPDGAGVDTIRELPMVTAADLEHAMSLLPASAEKDRVLSLIHDPQTIAAAMKAAGLFNPSQLQIAGQDLSVAFTEQAPVDPISAVSQSPLLTSETVLSSTFEDEKVRTPATPEDLLVVDPAVLGNQQSLFVQTDLPQPVPQPALLADAVAAPVADAQPVLPPEITSGPWGNYQSPVLPDQRFVRFILPKSEQDANATSASLFGIDIPEGAAFAPLAATDDGSRAADGQSVMAALADAMQATGAGQGEGPSLSSALAAMIGPQSGNAPSQALSRTSETDTPDLAGVTAPAIALTAASLFSSIFAKHGISQTDTELSSVSHNPLAPTAHALAALLETFDANPLKAVLGAVPQVSATPAPAPFGAGDEVSAEDIRNSLLKSLGGLKTAPAKGGLAAQLVNSQSILDLAAEEGLTFAQPAPVSAQPISAANSEMAALSSLANAGFAPVSHNNAFASAADLSLHAFSGNDLNAGGQGQTGGQGNARQDGQSANPQANGAARDAQAMTTGGPLVDDAVHAVLKKDEAFLSGADAHQTTVLSDTAAAAETASFSTASMATPSQVPTVSGGSLGARETVLGVTYALAGHSSPVTGSAVAAEMRFMSLGQQVMAALKQNSQEIELRLNPAQLGNVVLKLQVEGQRLSISAKTESQLSDEALSAGEDGLRASLAAHGYQLDKFDVSHQEERRKSNRPETEQSHETERSSDDPFSFDLIA